MRKLTDAELRTSSDMSPQELTRALRKRAVEHNSQLRRQEAFTEADLAAHKQAENELMARLQPGVDLDGLTDADTVTTSVRQLREAVWAMAAAKVELGKQKLRLREIRNEALALIDDGISALAELSAARIRGLADDSANASVKMAAAIVKVVDKKD